MLSIVYRSDFKSNLSICFLINDFCYWLTLISSLKSRIEVYLFQSLLQGCSVHGSNNGNTLKESILCIHLPTHLLIVLNIETHRYVTTKNTKCNSRIACNSFNYHTSLPHFLSSPSFIHTVIKNDFPHSVDKSSILVWQLLFYNEVKGYYW